MRDITPYIPGIIFHDVPMHMYSEEAADILSIAALLPKLSDIERIKFDRRNSLMSFSTERGIEQAEIGRNSVFERENYIPARREDGMLVLRDPSPRCLREIKLTAESTASRCSYFLVSQLSYMMEHIFAVVEKEKLPQDAPLTFRVGTNEVTTSYNRFKLFRKIFMKKNADAFLKLLPEDEQLIGSPIDPLTSSSLSILREEWTTIHTKYCQTIRGERMSVMQEQKRFEEDCVAPIKKLLSPFKYDEEVLSLELERERYAAK